MSHCKSYYFHQRILQIFRTDDFSDVSQTIQFFLMKTVILKFSRQTDDTHLKKSTNKKKHEKVRIFIR